MASYRADIEIGVKGIQQLQAVTKEITTLSTGVDSINKRLAGATQSINAYNANLNKAAQTLNKVNAGTVAEITAVKQYVNALGLANAARDRQNKLIQEQIALQRKAVPTSNAGFGVQGPSLPPGTTRSGGGGGSQIGGTISSALIGGGFPLLFGQGPGAAAGGALGGLAGGLLGGGFGFALSIVGTALGQAAEEADKFNNELARLNVSVTIAGNSTKVTTKDVDNLAKSLSLTKDETLKLLSAFTGFGDARITKSLALLYGDDAGTLKSLAAVKDQADLAQVILGTYEKIGIERATQLINQLKLGDSASVELAFQKALLDAKIKQTEEGLKQVTLQDRIIAGLATVGSLQGGGPVIDPSVFGQGRVKAFRAQNKPQDILNNALKALNALRGATQGAASLRPDKGAARDAERAAKEAQRERERVAQVVSERTAEAQIIRIKSNLQDKIVAAETAEDAILAARLRGEEKLLDSQYRYARELATEKDLRAQSAIIYEGLTAATAIQRETERDINRIYAERERIVTDRLTELDYEIQLKYATTQEARTQIEIEREKAQLIKQGITDENVLLAIAQRRVELNKQLLGTDLIKERVGALSDEIIALTDLGTVAVNVADTISTAFSQAFQGIISGTMTAQEALSSFFKSVGDAFIQMAAEIIAKQMTMIILQTILKALGVAGGTPSGGGANPLENFNAAALQYRASGGPVTSNSPYIVGEKGPELFVPGTGGSVVPTGDLRSAMGAAPGSGGSPVLNMSFETSTINGVEYVSRDQLEAAMAVTRRQAARDGANRGMTMTLDRLQQSPSTRRRVGF